MASTLGQAMQLARTRLASAASPIPRLMIQRDHEVTESELLRRELDILRAGRENMPPQKRPDYRPTQRLAILQFMRLRGWNIKITAKRFVIHENTLRAWIKAVEGNGKPNLLAGAIVWNRMDDAVRWAAHELRRLCPEPEFGTRTMARHLLRAGIQISRSTMQRVLREAKPTRQPTKPRPAMVEPAGIKPQNLLAPKKPNHVWHSDITQIRILWFTFFIAAIFDGFSRKILTLKVYARTPCARNMAALVRGTAGRHGRPQFIITDNGGQFRKQFGKAMHRQHIRHVHTRVRAPFLNGKIERFFRTFKLWQRLTLFGLAAWSIQCRLDNFADWYNAKRPHSALGHLTPAEAWASSALPTQNPRLPSGLQLPQPAPIRARDGPNIQIQIARRNYLNDPHLPIIEINLRKAA
ncbi:MAG: transposase [Phycisphaerae bacterium]